MLIVAEVGGVVVSAMAVSVNALAAGPPAPSPQSGAATQSLMPNIFATVLVSLLAFLASQVM